MSSEARRAEVVIRAQGLSKRYALFARPEHRLKQIIVPRLERLLGRTPRSYYTEFPALTDVNFEIGRGETVGIIGRNGSGKSTLLQIVCGILRPSSGAVSVSGRIAALLELGAGFNPEFTGRENVYLNAAILGLSRTETDARFEGIARFADIGRYIDQPVKSYSSGMYVRLAFAVAVAVDPDILVVDEALAVGDEAFQRKCFARIEEIKAAGATILFVSHAPQMIIQLCTRALLMDAGELILDGRPKMVVGQYQRLAHAGPDSAPGVRAEIVGMARAAAGDVSSEPVPPAAGLSDGDGSDEASVPGPQVALEGFDPSLRPESTISEQPRGARIREVRFLTLAGDPVNILQLGRRYLCEYCVDFERAADDVAFSMLVRTRRGVALAGAKTDGSIKRRRLHVDAGSRARVQFEFACSFLPGVFFLNVRVTGNIDGDAVIMHRIVDAAVFRVAAEAELVATGQIDIGAIPRIHLDGSREGAG